MLERIKSAEQIVVARQRSFEAPSEGLLVPGLIVAVLTHEDGAKEEQFGGQGYIHFSMLGHPSDEETVYVGGL